MQNIGIEKQIIFLQDLIQKGLPQNRTDAEFDIFLDKLSGSLPLGADAPTFTSRKRIITTYCMGKYLFNMAWFILFFLLSVTFATFVWAISFSDVYQMTILLSFITLLSSWGLLYNFRKSRQQWHIFLAIRNTQQTQPDIKLPSHPILDITAVDTKFSRRRQICRILGLFISIISGVILYWLHIAPPEKILGLACIFPFFFMIGIGIILCPISKAESLYLYGTSKLQWQHMPALFKLCIIIGIIASAFMIITLKS